MRFGSLCLGPMDTGEGFINTYTCQLPMCVYKGGRVSEGDSGAGDVFVYMPCSEVMSLLVWLCFFVAFLTVFYLDFP